MNPILSNKNLFPSFFQALPNYQTLSMAIIQLLRHYNWTWIGIITSDDDVSEKQSQELKTTAANYEICVEYLIKMSNIFQEKKYVPDNAEEIFNNSTSQVVVICGKVSMVVMLFIEKHVSKAHEKTFILPSNWFSNMAPPNIKKSVFYGSLIFSPPTRQIQALKSFLQDISLINRPHDFLVEFILAYSSNCLTSDPFLNKILQQVFSHQLYKCNRTIRLGEIDERMYYTNSFGVAYLVYKSVYAMAHALHEMQLHAPSHTKTKYKEIHTLMKKYLRRISFRDPLGEYVHFNDKGKMATIYFIVNTEFITAKNFFSTRVVGYFRPAAPEGHQLTIKEEEILWKNTDIPVSRCSEKCPPGFKRTVKPGIHKCCFACLKCSKGEISNETVSIFCFFKTSTIFGIFILFRNTPVVRANNQTLSFVLLASIMLSFLCVFLFLGRPTHVTCMLRQTSFGIIFSVAISSILAKTILVYMAFKATKPGSSWRKFIGVNVTNGLVFFCSFLQVVHSIIWLSTSPPFPEMNTHLYQDKIILQCNEGSMLAFSMLLGYIGLLAAISFIVAFLARNLPDSFNEAKNITFSMLVVCSVWVAFIPAYLSVTGKNTVLVEIFAIISSSVGILGCIFLGKCYIILVRSDVNTKQTLSRQIK
ncbi:vomeronasal type-2 receptor [Pristimantis euphronides]